jgi:hypothetical protein
MNQGSIEKPGGPLVGRVQVVAASCVLGVVFLALGLAALAMPRSSTSARTIGYTQAGEFSYSAKAPRASVYGPGGLVAGQPILTNVVGPVHANFTYRLSSAAEAQLHGEVGLSAVVTVGRGLSRVFAIAAPKPFTGAEATTSGVLPLADITAYLNSTTAALGNAAELAPTVSLQPRVDVTGSLAGHVLRTTYTPELSFVVRGGALSLPEDTAADGSARPVDRLNPSDPSRLSYRKTVRTALNVGVAHLSKTLAMQLGLGVALACLLAVLWLARPLWGAGDSADPDRIRAAYGSLLVPIRDLSAPVGPIVEVESMCALADLAKRYE